jgi:hypothetical protein
LQATEDSSAAADESRNERLDSFLAIILPLLTVDLFPSLDSFKAIS